MPEELSLSKRMIQEYHVLDIAGEITYDDYEAISEYIRNNFPKKTEDLIISLSMVKYLDSAALSVLVKIKSELEFRKIQTHLMNVNEAVESVLKLTGTNKIFNVIKNEKDFVKDLHRSEIDKLLNTID